MFQLSQMFNVGSVGWSGVVILLFDDLLDYISDFSPSNAARI